MLLSDQTTGQKLQNILDTPSSTTPGHAKLKLIGTSCK